jgi:tripartite-type tricarboxylate transporter receptor subunit TctC
MKQKRWLVNLIVIGLGCILPISLADTLSGQPVYPARPINVLIGFGTGGVTDVSARFIMGKAEKSLGQPFVVMNNGGGGGAVAYGITAQKPPDGYNLVAASSTGLVRIPQFRTVPYRMDEFVPIMHYAASYLSPIVVLSSSPWKSFKELVEFAKKNPGKVTYSTTGVGSPHHMAMEYVAKQEGIKWIHVPYPGSMPALTALLGAHVQVQIGAGESIPYIKQGTVRILCHLGEKRIKDWPDVPTLRELGYDFFNENVFLFAAPRGTPSQITDKLDDTFHKAMADPEFRALLAKIELEPSYRNSADLKTYLEDAYVRIGRMIRELKIPKEVGDKK